MPASESRARVAGHFGEWLQGRVGPAGVVALVTLACPSRAVHATWRDAPDLTLDQSAVLLDLPRARAFLRALGMPARGAIHLRADLPPGGGAGMSTAALVALARAAGASEARIASACLATEGASDPLMLAAPDQVLWASRAARVLATMPPPPEAEILGGFFGPMLRTEASDMGFPLVDDLVARWVSGPDLAQAAEIASLSAARCTALRGPLDDPTPGLARALGALGWARAHTGPARALIYPPGGVPDGAAEALGRAGLEGVFQFRTGAFERAGT